MTTIIFKNENKAKVYEIRSAKTQGVYKACEIMLVVKTDDVNKIISERQYEAYAVEITSSSN